MAIALGGVGIVGVLVSQIGAYVSTVAKQRVAAESGKRLFRRVVTLRGLRHVEDPTFHDHLVLADQAGQSAPGTMMSALQESVQAVILITGFLGTVAAVWPPMGLLLIATAVPSLVGQLARAHQVADLSEQLAPTKRHAFAYTALLSSASAMKEMRVLGTGTFFSDRYADTLDSVAVSNINLERKNTKLQTSILLVNVGVSTIGLAVVAASIANGRFSVGDMTLFIAATAGIQGALGALVRQAAQVAQSVRMFSHYLAVIQVDDDLATGMRSPARLERGIRFHDVWFRYTSDSEWVLRGVTLTLRSGGTTGLVGTNGAGKSTVVKLLCRLYDPDFGVITWDGVDLRELDLDELRARFAPTYQDFHAYNLTAHENIGIGCVSRLSDTARVHRAAKSAGADSYLEHLQFGYDTLLNPLFVDDAKRPGAALSGGQWQRLAVARALTREDADFVILDEPNAGLDALAEHAMHDAVRSWAGSRGTLLVSHRLGVMTRVDAIAVLDGGRIAENGTHQSLMRKGGLYARLFALQADSYQMNEDREVI